MTSNGNPPDLVFVVRVGEPNESLRYVLRSMHENLPHARVWVAGYCPRWLTGVRCIPVPQNKTKWANSTGNLRAAVNHKDVAEHFVFAFDDTFVLQAVDEMPVLHRGPVREVLAHYRRKGIGGSRYIGGMTATLRFLEGLGIKDPLSYELHLPMPMEKAKARTALDLPAKHKANLPVLHKRTLYAAYWHIGGTRTRDVKLTAKQRTWPDSWRFMSTSKGMIRPGHPVGEKLRDLFPEPSPYERQPARRSRTARARTATR